MGRNPRKWKRQRIAQENRQNERSPLSLCPRSNSLTTLFLFICNRSCLSCSSIASLIRRASASRASRASCSSGVSSGGGAMMNASGSSVLLLLFPLPMPVIPPREMDPGREGMLL